MRLAQIVTKADLKYGTSANAVNGFILRGLHKNTAPRNADINTEKPEAKRASTIPILSVRELLSALYAVKNLELYTNTRADGLYIALKNAGQNVAEKNIN